MMVKGNKVTSIIQHAVLFTWWVQSEGLFNGGLPSERLLPPEGGR